LGDKDNPAIQEKVRWARETVAVSARQIFDSGLRVALGSDSMHGNMAFEVETAIRFGMAPPQALLAATAMAAEALRMDDRVGTLQAGRIADVLGVDGDPLEDPAAPQRGRFVMKDGRVLEESACAAGRPFMTLSFAPLPFGDSTSSGACGFMRFVRRGGRCGGSTWGRDLNPRAGLAGD